MSKEEEYLKEIAKNEHNSFSYLITPKELTDFSVQENKWFMDELVKWKSLAKRLVDESIKRDATNKRLKLKRKLDFNSFKSLVLIYRPLFNESELKNEWRDYCRKPLNQKS
jgi:hypothetical protein